MVVEMPDGTVYGVKHERIQVAWMYMADIHACTWWRWCWCEFVNAACCGLLVVSCEYK